MLRRELRQNVSDRLKSVQDVSIKGGVRRNTFQYPHPLCQLYTSAGTLADTILPNERHPPFDVSAYLARLNVGCFIRILWGRDPMRQADRRPMQNALESNDEPYGYFLLNSDFTLLNALYIRALIRRYRADTDSRTF
jgi:hypothetical protein